MVTNDEKDETDTLAFGTLMHLTTVASAAESASNLVSRYFAKDQLALGPSAMEFYLSFHCIGWVIKPLWGFLIDSCPIYGSGCRYYVILTSSLATFGFLAYVKVDTVWFFVLVLVFTNVCVAFIATIAQTLLVLRSGPKDIHGASSAFSAFWAVRVFAGAVLTLLAGRMLEHEPARYVLMSISVLFVVVLVTAMFMRESKAVAVIDLWERIAVIARLFTNRDFGGLALYIFAFTVKPAPTSAMFFFNVDVLQFTPSFIAWMSIITSVAQLSGYAVYDRYFSGVPFRQLFVVTTTILALVSNLPLIQVFGLTEACGISAHKFALLYTFIIALVVELLWLPMLVLASRLCPQSVQGTVFSLWLSIHNLGVWASGLTSAGLVYALGITENKLGNLWLLVVICSVGSLLPLTVLPLVPTDDAAALAARERATAAATRGKEA